MKLISFNFTKLDLEKKSNNLKDLKISTTINILDIRAVKSDFFNSSEGLLNISFAYLINYEKDIAMLNFYGNMTVSVDSNHINGVLGNWKDKKLPEEFKLAIFNLILKKSSLKALQFEEEFNLPPHISIPSFKPSDKKD